MEAVAQDMEGGAAGPLEVLKQICRSTLDFMLDPDLVRLHRLVIAEERLSPVSAKEMECSVLVFELVVARQLTAAIQAGEIPPQTLTGTDQVLISMLTGWATKQSLIKGVDVSEAERDEFFERAWSLFLNGVRGAVSP
jgi:hypothetical protein